MNFYREIRFLISLDAKWINEISTQEKNYEFRKYKIEKEVKRMWIYVNKPMSCLSYICAFFELAIVFPTKITEKGIGNDDFNNGLKVSKFAYRITELYKLEEQLDYTKTKSLGLFPPQKFTYLTKKTKAFNSIKKLNLKKVF